MGIDKFKFDETLKGNLYKKRYMIKKKPIVYFICNDNEGYVGISKKVDERIEKHLEDPRREMLNTVYVIHDDRFNGSVIEEIEKYLIRYIPADGKYILQNENDGQKDDHDYSNKNEFYSIFSDVWKELQNQKIVKMDMPLIENSALFKFSPYVYLNSEQYETTVDIIKKIQDGYKQFLICGGSGTGKTVLAIYLLKYLIDKKENIKIAFVVPNSALRGTLKKVFKRIKGFNANMVIAPNKAAEDNYDILIVDEAHRLKRKKALANNDSFIKSCKSTNNDPETATELDIIKSKSSVQILFYDMLQSVRKSDIPYEVIKEFSNESENYKLTIQNRVKGGKKYIDFIQKILQQRLRKPRDKDFDSYEFKIFDTFKDFKEAIEQKEREEKMCRMIAGYAWGKKKKSDWDFEIEEIKLKWNSKLEDWVNSKKSINEVGCIHTIQGYDLNYAGVIIGPEVTFDEEKNKIKIIKENYKDRLGKALTDEEELKEFIIHIYNVMLTRGIEGTYVYICDEKLREYFKKYVKFL